MASPAPPAPGGGPSPPAGPPRLRQVGARRGGGDTRVRAPAPRVGPRLRGRQVRRRVGGRAWRGARVAEPAESGRGCGTGPVRLVGRGAHGGFPDRPDLPPPGESEAAGRGSRSPAGR